MNKNVIWDGDWVCYQEGWIPLPCYKLLMCGMMMFKVAYFFLMLNIFVWFSRIALEFW